jgi:hypothetical protein
MAAKKVKTGTEIAWKWVVTGVALTFLAVYLLNNLKPNWIQPYTPAGWVQNPSPLPSDVELVPLGEEEEEWEGEY